MPKSLYRIPVLSHTLRAKSKGELTYVQQHKRNSKYFHMPVPEVSFPGVGVKIVEVEASDHAEAYRTLCATYLPGDDRPIQGKTMIKHFRAR